MSQVNPARSIGYRLGYGFGGAIPYLLVGFAVWLVLGGIVYMSFIRGGRVSIDQAIFNWPVVVIVAFMALLFVI
jgi:hypothetical protein